VYHTPKPRSKAFLEAFRLNHSFYPYGYAFLEELGVYTRGVFKHKNSPYATGCLQYSHTGSKRRSRYRWTINYRGEQVAAHHMVWWWLSNEWPTHEIDHLNRNPLDNAAMNLGLSDRIQQTKNLHRPVEFIWNCPHRDHIDLPVLFTVLPRRIGKRILPPNLADHLNPWLHRRSTSWATGLKGTDISDIFRQAGSRMAEERLLGFTERIFNG